MLMTLTGCSGLSDVHTVGVLGKADTDEAVIVFTDVNGKQASRKIDYPAEEYFGEKAVYYSADKISYDSISLDTLRKADRIENVRGLIFYHIENGCTYVFEDNNMLAVYKKGEKLREQSLDEVKVLKVEQGMLYCTDVYGSLSIYDVSDDSPVMNIDVSSLDMVTVTTVDEHTYLVSNHGYTLFENGELGSTYVYPKQFEGIEGCRGKYITVIQDSEFKTYEVSFDQYRMHMSDDIKDDIIGYVDFEKIYKEWYEKGYEVINFYGYVGR